MVEDFDYGSRETPSASIRNRLQPDRSRSQKAPQEASFRDCQNADFSQVNCFNHLAEQKKLRMPFAIAADRSRSRDQLIAAVRNRSRSRELG